MTKAVTSKLVLFLFVDQHRWRLCGHFFIFRLVPVDYHMAKRRSLLPSGAAEARGPRVPPSPPHTLSPRPSAFPWRCSGGYVCVCERAPVGSRAQVRVVGANEISSGPRTSSQCLERGQGDENSFMPGALLGLLVLCWGRSVFNYTPNRKPISPPGEKNYHLMRQIFPRNRQYIREYLSGFTSLKKFIIPKYGAERLSFI